MSRRCKIPDCSTEPNQSLFKLPSDPTIREKWLTAIRTAHPDLPLVKAVMICEKHFEKTDFCHYSTDETGRSIEMYSPPKRKRLKPAAVPHFGVPQLPEVSDRTHTIDESSRLMEISKTENETKPSTSGVLSSHDIHDQSTKLLAPVNNTTVTSESDRFVHCDSDFNKVFIQNEFDLVCNVCDRLWSTEDLKVVTAEQASVLAPSFPVEAENGSLSMFSACNTCRLSLSRQKMPTLAKINRSQYSTKPADLPPLDPITELIVPPRLPFMQIRRVRKEEAYSIIDQVIEKRVVEEPQRNDPEPGFLDGLPAQHEVEEDEILGF